MTTDTKTALLNSAERLARSVGFDGFSYADLAEDVGIRKASIHYHFSTKATLSVALMQRYAATVGAVCADIAATSATGGARLDQLVAFYRDALNDGKSLCLCVSFSISRENLAPAVIEEIGQFRGNMIGWIAEAFALGQADGTIGAVKDPNKEATALLALLEGAHVMARSQENLPLFDQATALVRSRLTLR